MNFDGLSDNMLIELALRLNQGSDSFWKEAEPSIPADTRDIHKKLFGSFDEKHELYYTIERELIRRGVAWSSPSAWVREKLKPARSVTVLGLTFKEAPAWHEAKLVASDWYLDPCDLVQIRESIVAAMSDTDSSVVRTSSFERAGGAAVITHPDPGKVRVEVGCKSFTGEDALYIIAKVLEVFPA